MILRVAHHVRQTAVEGPFERSAIWVQGCSLRCPGCCNAELFPRAGGREVEVAALLEEILSARGEGGIEGLTLLGGEPLEQLAAVTELCAGAQRAGLGVLLFTGFTLAEAEALPGFAALWPLVDTLVDGRFDARAREPDPALPAPAGGRRFLGSRNQKLHHRTPRYADPALWTGANSAELRVAADGTLSVHGFPRQSAALLALLRRA